MDCFNVFHCNLHSLCHLSCLIMIVAEEAHSDKLFVSLFISFSPALSSLMWHLSLCLFFVSLPHSQLLSCLLYSSLLQWLCGCHRSTTKPNNTEWVAMWTLLICLLADDSYAKPTPCSYTLTHQAMRWVRSGGNTMGVGGEEQGSLRHQLRGGEEGSKISRSKEMNLNGRTKGSVTIP